MLQWPWHIQYIVPLKTLIHTKWELLDCDSFISIVCKVLGKPNFQNFCKNWWKQNETVECVECETCNHSVNLLEFSVGPFVVFNRPKPHITINQSGYFEQKWTNFSENVPASLAQLVEWLLPCLGGTGFDSQLVWPFMSYHLILVCVNNDLNGSLRINSRLHARLNNQISHPIPSDLKSLPTDSTLLYEHVECLKTTSTAPLQLKMWSLTDI